MLYKEKRDADTIDPCFTPMVLLILFINCTGEIKENNQQC